MQNIKSAMCKVMTMSSIVNHFVSTNFNNEFMTDRVSETNPMVVTLDCPQQSNGYDCGMFAVLFAEKTMQYLIENDLQLANDEPLPSDFTENFTDWIKGAVNQGLIPSLRTSYTQYVSDIVNRKAQGKL